jgi:hypothetical protein
LRPLALSSSLGAAQRFALGLLALLAALLAAGFGGTALLLDQASLEIGMWTAIASYARSIPGRRRGSPGRCILDILPSIPFRQKRRIGSGRVIEDLDTPGNVLARCRFCLLHNFPQ